MSNSGLVPSKFGKSKLLPPRCTATQRLIKKVASTSVFKPSSNSRLSFCDASLASSSCDNVKYKEILGRNTELSRQNCTLREQACRLERQIFADEPPPEKKAKDTMFDKDVSMLVLKAHKQQEAFKDYLGDLSSSFAKLKLQIEYNPHQYPKACKIPPRTNKVQLKPAKPRMDSKARAAFRRSSVDRATKSFRGYSDLGIIKETTEKPAIMKLEENAFFEDLLGSMDGPFEDSGFGWFQEKIKKDVVAKRTDASEDKENVEPVIIESQSLKEEEPPIRRGATQERKKKKKQQISQYHEGMQLRRSKRMAPATVNRAEKENQMP